MSIESVLQVNIRLSEGGAAGVARTLADELRRAGVASPFAYGYGKRGGPSPLEEEYDGLQVTPAALAAINRVSYSTIGRETKLVSSRRWADFAEAVRASDVVHLHAIHSYFASTDRLLAEIIAAAKPVVWTLHDQWIMTGRCAQPGSCRLWESGCRKCPDLSAYPPARVDHAGRRWRERHSSIRLLQDSGPTSIVACADWLGEEAVTAGIRNVTVVKNSVDREFWGAVKSNPRTPAASTRNLFMCRDLRDRNKVNWPLLTRVSQVLGQRLTIMGDNPDAIPPSSLHIPAVMDRSELARVMREHDRLIFTSQVDYFPLTIAEALTAGLSVFALDSQAAREFNRHPDVTIFGNENALMEAVRRDDRPNGDDSDQTYGQSFFAPERMASEYMRIYESLTAV